MAKSRLAGRGAPVKTNLLGDLYVCMWEVEVAATSITSNDPTEGVTFAHAGTTGDYTLTFDADRKPRNVLSGLIVIEEDDATTYGLWTGYTKSTGVGTFTMYARQVAAVAASATITCAAKAAYIDGENMAVIGDGINAAVTFEADPAGDGATGTAVDISGSTTAADVAAVLEPLIAAAFPVLTTVDNLDGTISITHNIPGTVGNVTITENVADAGHIVTGMSGGAAEVAATQADFTGTIRVILFCSDSSLCDGFSG